MKKLYITLLTIGITITPLFSQTWMQQNSDNNNQLNTIGFASNNLTGWAFGDSTIGLTFQQGTIYKTVNQGYSWNDQYMGTDSIKILACHVFSSNSVIGVGKFQTTGDGAIIKTVNGGITWLRDTTSIPERLYDVHFQSSTAGWIVGRNGYIAKSIDSGDNWLGQSSGSSEDLFAISFSDLNNGWAVGSDGGAGGEILHTTDGGVNWTLQSTTSSGNLFGVYAVNIDTAFAVGESGLILFTGDGGTTWAAQTSGTTSDLSDVEFSTDVDGRAVGAGGDILITSDAGVTWTTELSNTTNDISDLFLGSNNINWYCGKNGDIYIFTLSAPNGINEESNYSANIYPNPANNRINFLLDEHLNGELIICDATGRIQIRDENVSGLTSLDITEINSGVYFYVILNENGSTVSGKFIKNE